MPHPRGGLTRGQRRIGRYALRWKYGNAHQRPERRLLDQLVYRFSRLQDSMGMKLLPMLLDLAEEPISEDATFAEKLQRLERLGALESVERWRQLREIRNQLAHEYEDAPALKAAVLNRFIEEIESLLALWEGAEGFAARYNA